MFRYEFMRYESWDEMVSEAKEAGREGQEIVAMCVGEGYYVVVYRVHRTY